MRMVLLKHTIGCLLILLLGFQSYSEGYLGLKRLGDKEFEYFYNVSICRNVPDDFKETSIWAKTDQCILLFSKENCQGSVYHLFPGFKRNLLEFQNRAVSFRACSLNEIDNEFKNPKTIFYTSKNNNTIAYKNPNSCQNLRYNYVEWGEGSVKTETCILLFKEENCKGEHYRASTGCHSVLGSFENNTKSFKSCTNDTSRMDYHTKFYRNSNFSGIIDDINLHPGCNKDIFLWWNTISIESAACVHLFNNFDCSGNYFKIEAGRHTSVSHSNLPITFPGVKSLRACNEDFHGGPSQNPLKHDVAFSKLLENDYPEYFTYERISATCQNIHKNYVKKANSVETKGCIFLYEKENCEGLPYKVHPGYHSSLGDFNGKLISFKACSKYDNEIEHHVKFYSNSNYTGVIDDIDVYPGCNKADLRTPFYSLSTPICLELYSDESCSNGHAYVGQAGNHSVFPKSIKSLRPCNPEDAARFQEPKVSNIRPFKLKATIIRFIITSDKNSTEIAQTFLRELGQRSNYQNEGSIVQTKRYLTETTINDKVIIERVQGLSRMSHVTVSHKTTQEFTSGFHSSLNTAFKETPSSPEPPIKEPALGESGSHTSAFGDFSVKFAGASLSVSAGYSFTGLHNLTKTTQKTYSTETNAFQTEKRNMEELIITALTSCYRETSTVETCLKEETKSFLIDQTITVNPCTEYDVTSFIKRTENFPVTYTIFTRVTGKYDDGNDLTAAELEENLDGLEFEEKMNDFEIVANGSSKLTLDFSWYSVLNGKGNRIEDCTYENRSTRWNINSVVFYVFTICFVHLF